jgi:glutamate dehydrogenase
MADNTAAALVGDMCEAAWQANATELDRLLQKKASPSLGDYDQRTPLHLAACSGSMQCVKLLVDKGASLAQDRFGCLPIHDAVRSGHKEVANYLRLLDINIEMSKDVMKQRAFGLIVREGVFAMATVQSELEYFFDLGLHPSYFEYFTLAETAHQIHCLIAAKCACKITNSRRIKFDITGENSATFMTTLEHSRETDDQVTKFLGTANARKSLTSMVSYLSKKPATLGGSSPLMIYHASLSPMSQHHEAAGNLLNEDDLQMVGSADFLRLASKEKLRTYQALMMRLVESKSAVIETFPADALEMGTIQVLVGMFSTGGTPVVKQLYQVFRIFGVTPIWLQRDTFANGAVIYDLRFPTSDMVKVSNCISTLPFVPFIGSLGESAEVIVEMAMASQITFEQAVWILAVAKFCFHFYPKDTPEYIELCRRFRHDPEGQAALDELYLKTMSELIQEERIFEALAQNIEVTKKAYKDFYDIARGKKAPFYNEELAKEVRSTVTDQTSRVILLDCLLKFNAFIRLTNFYKGEKPEKAISKGTDASYSGMESTVTIVPMAMAYRFDGSFLDAANKNLYPEAPYAIYMIVGRGFYGFHSRFRDVARGGIRVIRSRNEQVYKINASRLYEEAYNLAFTQQKKNKDIPEGGSKGTILLALTHQTEDASRICFMSYIDALLDCMLNQKCGIHSWLPTPELLFFGPDENTANFMDLGATRAQRRGYQFWKALTTGKSTALGGIPHDTYGMTTNSVHQYAIRLLEELGVREEDCTKIQTGGPDGDLGSNEILISKDKYLGIVDGSGVLYDPNGLDRTELLRLAKARATVSNFARARLSSQGFLVLINDLDVTLPDGTKIASGVDLRDTFHLSKYSSADLFVPCGGRPNAVHVGNVKQLFRADGSCKFKYIVEGANLFFTTDARKVLEAAGVKLFKDASTNKGGVTSSSLEVFASLAMAPEDHDVHMCVEAGAIPPQFYKEYVEDILEIIRRNADNEFRILWGQMKQGRTSIEATDQLSNKINFLTDTINNDLNETGDKAVINKVLQMVIPKSLIKKVGFESIWRNTPRNYLMAMVATNLASKYVYENGMEASEFKFYNYLKGISQQQTASY